MDSNKTHESHENKPSTNFTTASFTICMIFFVFLIMKLLHFEKLRKNVRSNYFCLFIGSAEDVMQKVLNLVINISSTPCNLWLGLRHYILIDKPDDLQIVLNSSSALGKPEEYRFFHRTSGEGLFAAPVEKWRHHRRIITPAFNMKLLESFFPIFNNKNRNLIKELENEVDTGEHLDAWKYIYANSLNIILETTMGFDENSDEKSKREFEKALSATTEAEGLRVYKPWLHPDFIFSLYSYFTGLDESYKIVHKFPMQVIKYKKTKLQQKKKESLIEKDTPKNKYSRTFLDILLELNEEGANFSDDDLRDETITMMIAGSETSALTNSFTLLMLAMHPEVQDRVYQEITEIIGTEDRFIELEDVQRMTYLDQCIKETLRLFPTGPVFSRITKHPIKLSEDFIIPSYTNIIIPPVKVHRNAEVYPNPLLWNPDNFIPEEIEKRHKYSFIPFSMGPRGCIGAKYAMLSMKVTLSKIIQNYQLKTDVKYSDIKLRLDLVLRSANGYNIKLYRRGK